MKDNKMKSLRAVLFIFIIIVTSGCYRGINGKVVDNATGKPLEGALVLVQWTRPDIHSIEGISIEVIMNTETLTDKEGRFVISSTPLNPLANPPVMIIYKEGYLPWRNDAKFPSSNTINNQWISNVTYGLDIFTNQYTFNQIDSFLFLPSGGNPAPMFEALKNKTSDRSIDEQRVNQRNKWLNDFRTVLLSLEKGTHFYDEIRSRLMDKGSYAIDWLIEQAKNDDSAVSTAMKENQVTINHLTEGSKGFKGYGSSSIVFTKR
jgi:hypothetical protein